MASSENKGFSRRNFLQAIIASVAGIIGVSLSGLVSGYFLSPLLRKEPMEWTLVADIRDIPLGTPAKVVYSQRTTDGWVRQQEAKLAWVLTEDGQRFTVYEPHCTHLGCGYFWHADKKVFFCPCHDGVYDIQGNVLSGPPPRPLDRMENKVEQGKLYVGRVFRVKA